MSEPVETSAAPRSTGGAWVYVMGFLVVAGAVGGVRALRNTRRAQVRDEGHARVEAAEAGPHAMVVTVGRSRTDRTLQLLGEARAYRETTLYGKVSGYLRSIRVERGDHVRAGDLLAVVEAPETEQQYVSAVAAAENRREVADRARRLVGPGIVSQQDLEAAESGERQAATQVRTADLQRGYRELRAPFAGVVTARWADPGALVQNATSSQSGALPVVRVSQVDRLRVFVYVDQRDAARVHAGVPVEIRFDERPGVKLDAQVSRVSGALDARSRTLLAEIDLDNRDGSITPGSFVQVSLRLQVPALAEIPSEALVMHGLRPFVAVVGDDRRLTLRPVELADDDGARLRVLSGVNVGDRLAINLGDAAHDGMRIQPEPAPVRAGP